ncbi:hypothetical protein ACFQE1_07415 [Halobium palmae]|uniref:Uncharacterized protein n=1 Tax=Halobium palmae TaxID=1776492 RepID=A0ABD5RY90_9EURY
MDSVSSTPLSDSIVSACRTGLGDELRSVVYFTPDEFEPLYLRRDLAGDEAAHGAEAALVENERLATWPEGPYVDRPHDPDLSPTLGDYECTVRMFSGGFVGRVVVGRRGVIVTTDELDVRAFEELAVSLRSLLAEGSG